MRNRIPQLFIRLGVLALIGSACGGDPGPNGAAVFADESPRRIVTTTTTVPTTDASEDSVAELITVPNVEAPTSTESLGDAVEPGSNAVASGPDAPTSGGSIGPVWGWPAVPNIAIFTVPPPPAPTAIEVSGDAGAGPTSVTTDTAVPTSGGSVGPVWGWPAVPNIAIFTVPPPPPPTPITATEVSGAATTSPITVPDADADADADAAVTDSRLEPSSEPGQYWRPDLQEEAFGAIDPWSVGADIWYEQEETFLTAPHRFYRFYHMRGDTQAELWRHWQRTLDVFWGTPIIYYPVRYDLSWHDYPDTAKVVATWPLGEQREMLVTDGVPLAEIDLPSGPPLPPTVPYAEPDFPDTAALLGRDCPPVEALWSLDAPVQDPCTLSAVHTALQYANAAATREQVQAAVRDGHVLAETIAQIHEIDKLDSSTAYWSDPANPGHYVAEVRDIRWAGRFPGASLISAEFRIYSLPGLAPPDIQAQAKEMIQEMVDAGGDIPEWVLGEQLPTEPPPPEVGFWDRMLMVRTADGTWRMSYPMWCFSMQSTVQYESLECPDDPNPVWSDSIWDFDLYPPNDMNFWLNATLEQREYRGVPPS